MDREPAYPDDAPVGTPPSQAEDPTGKTEEAERESGDSNRARTIVAGAAIGIGSAALVAALLYANRSRKGEKASK